MLPSKRSCEDVVQLNQPFKKRPSSNKSKLRELYTPTALPKVPKSQASQTQDIVASGKGNLNPEGPDLTSGHLDPVKKDDFPETSSARPRSKYGAEISAIENGDVESSSKVTTYCFGMILGSFALFPQSKNVSSLLFRVGSKVLLQLRVRSDGISVLLPAEKDEIGVLDLKTTNSLTALMAIDPTATFEPYLNWMPVEGHDWKPQGSNLFPIYINIYGNSAKLDDIGCTLSTACLYLQEPLSFNRNFIYCNLHVLSWSSGNTPMFLEAPNDSIADFSGEIDMILNESATVDVPANLTQPTIISTTLLPHQLAALQFMLTRELGSSSSEERSMWEPEYHGLRILFKHRITNIRQARMTLKCRGGILADDMGMGKSLTLLALVLHTLEEARKFGETPQNNMIERQTKGATKATLLIAPKSTLYNWQVQVKEHTLPGSIKLLIYHGSGRTATYEQLANADIVLTTFETASSDFNMSETLRNVSWFRIVLDEAHHIRNRATRTFQAIEELVAERRWCLTGTLVQNKLDDLFSLTQYLRFHPLENHTNARKFILEPLGRKDKTAITKLRLEMQTIALRRTQTASSSKNRDKIIVDVDLTPQEHERYVFVRDKIRQLAYNSKASQSHALLLCILYLRQLCSHGQPGYTQSPNIHGNGMPLSGYLSCDKCGEMMSSTSQPTNQDTRTCVHRVCAECKLEEMSSEGRAKFAFVPQCCVCGEPIIFNAIKNKHLNELSPTVLFDDYFSETSRPLQQPRLSTKIQSVLDKLIWLDAESDLETGDPVKSLVFSHWGKTLDVLGTALQEHSLQFLRLDGSMTLEQRGTVMLQFKTSLDIKVLLLTYASGSVGLNLAMATRVHLLEPHWNPMVEAQAAARIDRLDQAKDIVIYHYIVKQSIEELIVRRQRDKVVLAELSLSKVSSSNDRLGVQSSKGLETLLEYC
ncbi:hypothetical protein BDZ45DRAFT_674506 [Acephala macrosclerotiorum]|nr:hypothetical protein BDZ45DRAFT_674506 [Acephala macrosclerotiorum]